MTTENVIWFLASVSCMFYLLLGKICNDIEEEERKHSYQWILYELWGIVFAITLICGLIILIF